MVTRQVSLPGKRQQQLVEAEGAESAEGPLLPARVASAMRMLREMVAWAKQAARAPGRATVNRCVSLGVMAVRRALLRIQLAISCGSL